MSMPSFPLRTEQDRSRAIEILRKVPLDKPLTLVIKQKDRSLEQNAAMHAMLTDISKQVEHAGQRWNVTIWKRLCTAAWLREKGESPAMIPAIDGNGVDLIYEKTSKLNVTQCSELIEWILAFGAEHGVKWTQKDYWGGRY